MLLATVWGSTWLFIKIGLEDLPPFTFAALRFVVALMPLVLWMVVRRVRLPRSRADWWLMIVTGLLTFTMNYSLVFWGESHISSGLAAILYTTFPLQGLVLAHVLLPEEPMTLGKVAGVAIAAAGVVLIFYNQVELRGLLAFAGAGALVVAAFGTALADVLIKRQGVHIEPVTMTAVQMGVGVIPMLALGLLAEGNPLRFHWTGRAVFSLLYLAFVGSALTFVLLYWLIQRMQVTRTMLIPLWSTLIAVLLGAAVLGERLGWRVLAGAGGILVGLVVAVRAGPGGRAGSPAASGRV